jgi:hypothetical protein
MTVHRLIGHEEVVTVESSAPDIAAAALRLAHGGHPVVPLHSIGKSGRCTCGRTCPSAGKHPRLLHGLKDASSDLPTVAAWWRRWKLANVGLLTGAEARIIVIDLDGQEGMDSWSALTAGRDLPPTRECITGGAGRHVYWLHPGGVVRNSAGRLGHHVDVRGDGGYVVAPPSTHNSGERYRWANRERVAPCPDWLVDLLRPPPPAPRPPGRYLGSDRLPPGASRAARYGEAALALEEASVRMAIPGTRNHRLNAAAFSLGQLVGAGLLNAHEVGGVLLDAAVAAGLTESEAWATIRSGLTAGQLQPRARTA